MTETTPLALPLRVETYYTIPHATRLARIMDANNRDLSGILTPEAAEFIVTAVNGRAGLVEAVQVAHVAMTLAKALTGVSDEYDFGPAIETTRAALSPHNPTGGL